MADDGKLNRWRLFADLTAEEAELVVKLCEERFLVAGEELFHESDPGDSLFILQSGRVEIFKTIRGDVDRVIASFGPGDVIGEISFVDGARRSAGARTTEPSEFLVLTRGAFAEGQKARPEIAARLFRNLAAILASRFRATTDLFRESVAFGMEATGAQSLNLRAFAEEMRVVTVHLSGGAALQGRILQMDQHQAGFTVVIKMTNDKLTVVPYHAIQRIDLG